MRHIKMIIWLIALILSFSIAFAAPNVTFISQIPADISTFNVFGSSVNMTYNITDSFGIDANGIKLYYKTNSTISDCSEYVNSTASCGFQQRAYAANTSGLFIFRLFDNNIYPGVYNFDERAMEATAHSAYGLNTSSSLIKIRLFNVSNQKDYNVYEIMANNTNIAGTQTMRVFYCNSSYVTEPVLTSFNCVAFFNVNAQTAYNHTHSASSMHLTIPFSVNKTTGNIGAVHVTSTSYFILAGRTGTNAWRVHYVTNISQANTIQTSTTTGTSWSNFPGTVDSHLHQYDGSEKLWYYACANDTNGDTNCTDIRYDLINLTGIPPTAPSMISPAEGAYSGNITINYTSSESPNSYSIVNYNISLFTVGNSFVQLIAQNNSVNLNYTWNSAAAPDGEYVIKVLACDSQSQCTFGESQNITIDNKAPGSISNLSYTSVTSSSITWGWTNPSDSDFSKVMLYLNGVNTENTSSASTSSYTASSLGSSTSYLLSVKTVDTSGNINSTFVNSTGTTDAASQSSSGNGGGSYTQTETAPVVAPVNPYQSSDMSVVLTESGGNFDVSQGSTISFSYGTDDHTISMLSVGTDSVIVEVSSHPQTVSLKVGETKEADIDDDSENDIAVTLKSIVSGLPRLVIKMLKPAPVQKAAEQAPVVEAPKETPVQEQPKVFEKPAAVIAQENLIEKMLLKPKLLIMVSLAIIISVLIVAERKKILHSFEGEFIMARYNLRNTMERTHEKMLKMFSKK